MFLKFGVFLYAFFVLEGKKSTIFSFLVLLSAFSSHFVRNPTKNVIRLKKLTYLLGYKGCKNSAIMSRVFCIPLLSVHTGPSIRVFFFTTRHSFCSQGALSDITNIKRPNKSHKDLRNKKRYHIVPPFATKSVFCKLGHASYFLLDLGGGKDPLTHTKKPVFFYATFDKERDPQSI